MAHSNPIGFISCKWIRIDVSWQGGFQLIINQTGGFFHRFPVLALWIHLDQRVSASCSDLATSAGLLPSSNTMPHISGPLPSSGRSGGIPAVRSHRNYSSPCPHRMNDIYR